MTNSDAPSPKKGSNHHDSFFSAVTDDDGEFDNVVVNAALKDLKGSSRYETPSVTEEKNLDKRLMDRKRLRIFSTITKKKTLVE